MPLPIKFLLSASTVTLYDFELRRRNHAANLRKELRALEEQIREMEAEALFTRWLIENRAEVLDLCRIDCLQLRLYPERTGEQLPEKSIVLDVPTGNK